MSTIFSSAIYHQATDIEVETVEFKVADTVLQVQYCIDEINNHFHVGKRSTFGHINFSGSNASEHVKDCLDLFVQYLLANFKTFTVKFPPMFYFQGIASHLNDALKQLNKISVIEDCYQSRMISSDVDVIQTLSRTNRRIHRRLERSGHYVCENDHLTCEGYALLAENRMRRNVELSLSYKALYSQACQLKDYFRFFETRNKYDILCAYAVTLRLSADWLYVFYWGETTLERKRSPVVMLAAEIMRYCQQEGIQRLDAGTSSISGELDQTLYDFKRRLGFIPSSKFTVSNFS